MVFKTLDVAGMATKGRPQETNSGERTGKVGKVYS
jgi:hypothetical protein